jgi:oligopeptide transport system ATP-binding protein
MVNAQAPLLKVENLKKTYVLGTTLLGKPRNVLRATDGVSFSIGRGEIYGLVGESGSGKSTVGKLLLRLIDADSGRIEFDGTDISRMPSRKLRPLRPKMQMVFQDPFSSLNPRMTVGQILEMPMKVQPDVPDAVTRRARVKELVDLVGLNVSQLSRYPHEFSGGQRQRISIARALVTTPQFLVADEPVSALDVSIQAQIIRLFLDVRKRLGLGMLFISHDLAVVGYMCDRIAVMYLGRIVEAGATTAIFRSPSHPYTEALLSAAPSVKNGTPRKRVLLTGDIPSPMEVPSGCAFRKRCHYATEACAAVVPALRQVTPGHWKACIRDDLDLRSALADENAAA